MNKAIEPNTTTILIRAGECAGNYGTTRKSPAAIKAARQCGQKIGISIKGDDGTTRIAWPFAEQVKILAPCISTIKLKSGDHAGSTGWCHATPRELADKAANGRPLHLNINGRWTFVHASDCLLVSAQWNTEGGTQ